MYFGGVIPSFDTINYFTVCSHQSYPTNSRKYNKVTSNTVFIDCVWDEEDKQQIAQVEICLDKQFKPTCNQKSRNDYKELRPFPASQALAYAEPCRPSEKICYFPISH